MRNLMARTAVIAALVAAAGFGMAWAQAQPPAQKPASPQDAQKIVLPDIVGFRPGITAQEAYDKLKAYNPRAKIAASLTPIPQLSANPLTFALVMSESGESSAEIIETDLTLPPGKQVVWRIARRFTFDPGKEMLLENLLATLREKYGHESQPLAAVNPQMAVWYFDAQGRPAKETGGLVFNNCNILASEGDITASVDQNTPPQVRYNMTHPIQRGRPEQELCRNLIKVEANWQVNPINGLWRVPHFTVALADYSLQAPAQDATAAAINGSNGNQQQRAIDRANKQDQESKPKL